MKNDCACASLKLGANVMESCFHRKWLLFLGRNASISQYLFVKKSAGYFEIHKSIIFVGKCYKNGMNYHEYESPFKSYSSEENDVFGTNN